MPLIEMDLYWWERKKIIQELQGFNIPIHVIGAIPENMQAIILGKLKTSNPYKKNQIIKEIIETYQDK